MQTPTTILLLVGQKRIWMSSVRDDAIRHQLEAKVREMLKLNEVIKFGLLCGIGIFLVGK